MSGSTRNIFYVFLLIGIVSNVILYFYLSFSLQNKLMDKLDSNLSSLRSSLDKMVIDSYSLISDFARSNTVLFVTNSISSSSSVSSVYGGSMSASSKSNSPLFEVAGSLDYHYFVKDGRHCAYIGTEVFSSGSPFPQGGKIEQVYPNGILLEGGYFISNSRYDKRLVGVKGNDNI